MSSNFVFVEDTARTNRPRNFISAHRRILIFASCGLTSSAIILDRSEGLWNRSILAGVRTNELCFAIIVTCSLIMTLSSVLIFVALNIVDIEFFGNYFLIASFIFGFCFCGLNFGLFIAFLCPSFQAMSAFVISFSCCTVFLMGKKNEKVD